MEEYIFLLFFRNPWCTSIKTLSHYKCFVSGSDEYEVSHGLCTTCNHLTAFAFCSNCKGFYCESCYTDHEQDYESHTILQIKHIHVDTHSAKCLSCKEREPTRVCATCETLYCEQCLCNHKHKPILVETEKNNKNECDKCSIKINENIKTSQSILIPRDKLPTRICGISVLPNGQVVIADSNNRKLKVLTGGNKEPTLISFTDEPRGMTGMFDNQVAVTFPHNRKIKIFDVNIVNPKDTFDMENHGKPFAISYNNELFAVEIGERDDGCIIILTLGGTVHRKIRTAKKYAYFTGHTIRLALDKSNERLFISAMSKKAVTCLDFEGKQIWTQQFTSPRGISLIQGHGKLFLASKRRNRVYQINAANGNGFALASHGDIMSPRYIAYSQAKSKMYIQVIHGDDEDDKIVALKYKI